jgi:carbonic anhydrase
VHVINIDGETDVDALQAANPEIDDRIERLWEY